MATNNKSVKEEPKKVSHKKVTPTKKVASHKEPEIEKKAVVVHHEKEAEKHVTHKRIDEVKASHKEDAVKNITQDKEAVKPDLKVESSKETKVLKPKLNKVEQISLMISVALLFILVAVAVVVFSRDKQRISNIFMKDSSSSSEKARVDAFKKDNDHDIISVPACGLQFKFKKDYTYSVNSDKTDKNLKFTRASFKVSDTDFLEITCVKTGNKEYPQEIKNEEANFGKVVDINKDNISYFDSQTKKNIESNPSPRLYSELKNNPNGANVNVELFVIDNNSILSTYTKKDFDISAKSISE